MYDQSTNSTQIGTPPTNPVVTPASDPPIPQTPLVTEPPKKGNSAFLFLGLLLGSLLLIGGGYTIGKIYVNNQERLPGASPPVVVATPVSTALPAAANTFTSGPFSITLENGWVASDSAKNPEFFTKNKLTGFDQMVALSKGNNHLVIGIDKTDKGAEAGGIWTTDTQYQEYLKVHDEATISGKRYLLWDGSNKLGSLSGSSSGAGVYSLASLSEFIKDKKTTADGKVFNGFDDYITDKTSGYSYMFIKLSENGELTTPALIQSEIIKMLSTIKW